MTIQPLKGLRVLDLTLLPPGGFCTILLADLGAEVLRVDAPNLVGQRSLVLGQPGISRGKRSITLDQRNARANEILSRLVKASDIVVENAKPGAMEARGFGYRQACEVNPGIVWCSISGFGQDGPYADRAGHDLSYLGHSGVLGSMSPELPWHPAAMVSVPMAGAMAANGILAALVEKSRTGKGCQVDISIAEATTFLLAGQSAAFKDGFKGIQATHDRRLYKCADGKFVSVAAAEPRTWGALCKALGVAEFGPQLKAQGAESKVISDRLSEIFATRPAAQWVAELGPLGAAVNAVNQGRDIVDDPQYRARGATVEVLGDHVPAAPVRLTDAAGRKSATASDAPAMVGEDTDRVFKDAGFSADEIATLRADGVI